MTRPILIGAPFDDGRRHPGCLMDCAPDRSPLALSEVLPQVCASVAEDPRTATPARTGRIRHTAGRDDWRGGGIAVVLGKDHPLIPGDMARAAEDAAADGQTLFLRGRTRTATATGRRPQSRPTCTERQWPMP